MSSFIAQLVYPIGFIAVIVGRAQLFTENTLYPVALMFAERRHFRTTLRLWSIVLPSNLVGAFLFAVLAVRTGALRSQYVAAMVQLGQESISVTGSHVFWSAVIGGWIIALVAWLVSGSHSITGSVMLIWLLTFLVGFATPGDRVAVFFVAASGRPGEHHRRCADRDAAGVRPGQGRGRGRPRISPLMAWKMFP
jgi:formate/nitrite transporter FocA (FNT family)